MGTDVDFKMHPLGRPIRTERASEWLLTRMGTPMGIEASLRLAAIRAHIAYEIFGERPRMFIDMFRIFGPNIG